MIQITDIQQLLKEYDDNRPQRVKKAKKIQKELDKIKSKNKEAFAERQRIRGLLRGDSLSPFQRQQFEFLVEKDSNGNYPNLQANPKTMFIPTEELKSQIKDLNRKNPYIYVDLGIDQGKYRLDLNRAMNLDDLALRLLERRKEIVKKDLEQATRENKEKNMKNLQKLLNQLDYNIGTYNGDDVSELEEEFDEGETDIKPIGIELFNETITLLT